MSRLIVIGFDDEADAFAFRQDLVKAQSEYIIKLEDAVVVTRPSQGEYQLHQALNLTAAGAVGGAFWGGLIGMLFLNPLLGAAVGSASGALAGSGTDYGIPDDFIRQIGKTVPVGRAAVFVLASELNADKLLPRLQERYGARAEVIQTSLTDADESRLRQAFTGQWQGGQGTVTPAVPTASPAATPGDGAAHAVIPPKA